jgi:molybdenum transport protein
MVGPLAFSTWDSGLDDDLLRALLREDAPHGDLSTRTLGLDGRPAQIRFEARAGMVVAGLAPAARLLQLCGVQVQALISDGTGLAAGEAMLLGRGPAGAVLQGWKTAQTLVEACSGIASATAAIVRSLREAGFTTPLACTRKNFPGTRRWAAEAVQAGGGVMHRLGLSESLLVFPEHRALLGEAESLARVAALRRSQPEKTLVVEVTDAAEALAMARAGAQVLQLERFSPAALAALKQRLRDEGLPVRLAPAGGVSLANALAYAQAGADLLVSSAPYFAPPMDVKVHITPA